MGDILSTKRFPKSLFRPAATSVLFGAALLGCNFLINVSGYEKEVPGPDANPPPPIDATPDTAVEDVGIKDAGPVDAAPDIPDLPTGALAAKWAKWPIPNDDSVPFAKYKISLRKDSGKVTHDNITNLDWKHGGVVASFAEAFDLCKKITFRLPTRIELVSLVNHLRFSTMEPVFDVDGASTNER
jgi:hypothetical protein